MSFIISKTKSIYSRRFEFMADETHDEIVLKIKLGEIFVAFVDRDRYFLSKVLSEVRVYLVDKFEVGELLPPCGFKFMRIGIPASSKRESKLTF